MFALFQILMLIDGFFTWSLIGQGALALLIGRRRHDNLVYGLLARVNAPVLGLARALTPRFVDARFVGLIAVLLLIALRFVLYFVWYANGWIPTGVGQMPTG